MAHPRSTLTFLLLLTACPGAGAVLTEFTGETTASEAASDPGATAGEGGTIVTSAGTSTGETAGTSTGTGETPGTSTGTGTSTGNGETPGTSTGELGGTAPEADTDSSTSSTSNTSTSSSSGDPGDTSTGGPCDCPGGCVDGDQDGYPDACDNCPEIANPHPEQELPWNNQVKAVSDYDQDGLGNVCDACPHSPKTGAVPGENCCDPRVDACTKTYAGSVILYACSPDADGAQFICDNTSCGSDYQQSCFGCDGPCMPAGALARKPTCPENSSCDCDTFSCVTKWCTVGDDASCMAGNVCLAWYAPGEAPAGLDALGVCAKQGACAGEPGRACANWK